MERFVGERVSVRSSACLARMFSTSVVKELVFKGYSAIGAGILAESQFSGTLDPKMPLREFFERLFALLFRNYRNEYIYKSAIANKILLGIHSLNTSFMLTEFRAADCKADAVILNGTSSVYEIKSEFDNLDRLKRQLSAYRQVFDHVHVITSYEQLEKVSQVVDESVGLMVLGDRQSICTVRNSQSMKHYTKPDMIFDSLRKHEYVEIVKKEFGALPDVPNTRIYADCKALFCKLPPELAHDDMVWALKKRGDNRVLREFVMKVPPSLKALSLSCKLSSKERETFLKMLDRNTGECLGIS